MACGERIREAVEYGITGAREYSRAGGREGEREGREGRDGALRFSGALSEQMSACIW